MPLTIRMHTASSIPVEVGSLKLETLRGQTLDEIRRTSIFCGNQEVACADFFDITGSVSDDNTVIWEGPLSTVKRIGMGHSEGHLRVVGDPGMHLGSGMTGGKITVEGNAGDWVGAEMKGGQIHIRGNAGNLVGAVYRGGRKGMTGGEIFIEGNAGTEVGHTMRRGLIAVGGSVGDAAGVGMIAGSILIFGKAGSRNGAGMKRGTIGLLHSEAQVNLLPSFYPASTYQPLFFQQYFRHLQNQGFAVPDDCWTASYQRYCGDMLELGKGEIFTTAK